MDLFEKELNCPTYDVTRRTDCDPAKLLANVHVVKLGLTSLRLPSEGALAPRCGIQNS